MHYRRRPVVKVQWLFKVRYLYGIVELLIGELMIQDYPGVNTETFQHFLSDFSRRYPNDFHVIQVDNARFHCAHYMIPPG